MRIFEITELNFDLISGDKISSEFLRRGLRDFRAALIHVWRLPYGRNLERRRFSSCSQGKSRNVQHETRAARRAFSQHKHKVFLTLGIYEMNRRNTVGVGAVLEEYGLENLPEAHCYLTYGKTRIDVTRISNGEAI